MIDSWVMLIYKAAAYVNLDSALPTVFCFDKEFWFKWRDGLFQTLSHGDVSVHALYYIHLILRAAMEEGYRYDIKDKGTDLLMDKNKDRKFLDTPYPDERVHLTSATRTTLRVPLKALHSNLPLAQCPAQYQI